jgi:hypothetical protein
MDAARHGRLAEIGRLIDEGAEVDAQGAGGRTALHEAAAHGHVEAAACLLARGARADVDDRKGQKALDAANTPLAALHGIRQHYHRRRTLDAASERRVSAQAREWASELTTKGIVKVSGLIPPDTLAQLRDDFERFIEHIDERHARGEGLFKHYDEEEHFWEKDRAFITNNAFRFSDALARFPTLDAPRLAYAQLYLGRVPRSSAVARCAISRVPRRATTCSAGTTTWRRSASKSRSSSPASAAAVRT